MESLIEEGRRQVSSALELSYSDAETICRKFIKRLEIRSDDIDAINEFRGRLITILTDSRENDADPDPIREEFDKLFAGLLTTGDKRGAAETLVWKFEFLEGKDWQVAFETAYSVIELFGASPDSDVVNQVEKAFRFLFEKLPEGDDRFAPLCSSYGEFMERDCIPADFACELISEIDEGLDGNRNDVAIPIIESFLASRSTHLTEDGQQKLRGRLAANYLYVGRFKETIRECSLLMVGADSSSLLDYMLWCGEAFLNLESHSVAAMYFREVGRMLEHDETDTRLQDAHRLLERIPDGKLG